MRNLKTIETSGGDIIHISVSNVICVREYDKEIWEPIKIEKSGWRDFFIPCGQEYKDKQGRQIYQSCFGSNYVKAGTKRMMQLTLLSGDKYDCEHDAELIENWKKSE